MTLQRIFLSAPHNPTATEGPSGVADSIVAPAVPLGSFGNVQFPKVVPGGALLIKNNGTHSSVIFYDDAIPAGDEAWPAAARQASITDHGGRVNIPAGRHVVVVDTNLAPTATYTHGPLTLIAGTYAYAFLEDPADHPDAKVKA